MKRFSLALVATLMAYSGYAQTFIRRGNVENVTDYSALAKSSARGARKVGLRSTAALPCTGSPKIPVVLVQFADTKFMDYDKEGVVNKRYDDYFNLKHGNANNSIGSVYQYFKEQSYGQFTPEFDVMGPVTLSKNYAYYGEDELNKVGNKWVSLHKDIHIKDFYREVCQYVVSNENKNWKDYDNDNDNKVDMIFFIYAGEGQNPYGFEYDEKNIEKSYLIWPKESGDPLPYPFGDVVFGSYAMTNELYDDDIDGIGTACHELSHGLGLPDLYDTETQGKTILDVWDVMDGGNYQCLGSAPIGYSAYERDFMGWRQIVTLETDKPYSLTINPLETDGVAYKVVNPENKNEYLILENRQNMGYDKYMPWPNEKMYDAFGGLHGLMITHVDYDLYSWKKNKANGEADHQRYQIVPADGEFLHTQIDYDRANPEESARKIIASLMGDLYPGSKNVHEISSYTMFNGGKLNQTIDNIREKDGIIYVDINGGTIIPALQQQLKDDLIAAGEYVSKKMGKKEADALSAAITVAENVARDQDAIEKCIADLKDAVTDAKTSIELYEKVAGYIADVDELGEAAKESFMDVRTNYEDGEITSIEDVDKAYAEAVAAQEAANAIDIVTQDVEGQSIYTLDGKLVKSPVKGVNIMKTVNGLSKKVDFE
ncbi:MAG: M6 family metalloprotease domain-containing protein [Bacteroidaceae bacterium]|nr:M6 family metalloprotease domain-containing protein [Bacteroidaceae bacterium]